MSARLRIAVVAEDRRGYAVVTRATDSALSERAEWVRDSGVDRAREWIDAPEPYRRSFPDGEPELDARALDILSRHEECGSAAFIRELDLHVVTPIAGPPQAH